MREAATQPRKPGERRTAEGPGAGRSTGRWEPPAFEVIPLDCEITAYAPAGDDPLF